MARPQLKKLVASVVADLLSDSRWARVRNIKDVKDITVTHPTDLVTLVRVVTESDGVHYYEVRVKETM